MKFIVNPSLQQMTLVKIVAELWNQVDIRKLIKNFKFTEHFKRSNKEWREVEVQVSLKVSHFQLPESLKKDLICFIKPIGYQIRAWCTYHDFKDHRVIILPEQFSWTPEGTIDRKRTAETLVKDKVLDLDSRYQLACINCLEEEIPELWKQIPVHQKLDFPKNLIDIDISSHKLVQFWTYHLFGEASDLNLIITWNMWYIHPPHLYALSCAVEERNLTATKFFFNKLSDEERDTLSLELANKMASDLFSSNRKVFWTGIFPFLLSQMSEERQSLLFAKCPQQVLWCFTRWPYQPLFLDIAERVVRFIPEDSHNWLAYFILTRIFLCWTDFDYRQLFRQYWNLIPLAHKNFAISGNSTVSRLMWAGEEDMMTLVLKGADDIVKERFILSEMGLNLCEKLVEVERWSSLELLLKLCVPSKEVIVSLKERVMERCGWDEMSGENRLRFFRLLDDLVKKKSEKRNDQDDDENPSKKLRTE